MTTGTLAFAPKVNQEDFRCFFSTGSGWGTFEQRREGERYRADVALQYGELRLQVVRLPVEQPLIVTVDGERLEVAQAGGALTLTSPTILASGHVLSASG